jgi:hypothetical protein
MSRNLGALASWNPKGLSRPVMGLLYLYIRCNAAAVVKIYILVIWVLYRAGIAGIAQSV